MDYVSASEAPKNLDKLMDTVIQSHVPVYISGPRGNAVLISEEDWNSIQETLYLHSIPGLVEQIQEARKEPEEAFIPYDPNKQW